MITKRQYYLRVKGKVQMYIIPGPSFNFWPRVIIFGAMIVHDVKITTNHYDIGVKGQCQIYIWHWPSTPMSNIHKIWLTACNFNSSFIFWWSVFTFSTMIAYGMYFRSPRTLESKVKYQGQIYLNYVVWLVTSNSSPLLFIFFFDGGCYYLAQWLLIVCIGQ